MIKLLAQGYTKSDKSRSINSDFLNLETFVLMVATYIFNLCIYRNNIRVYSSKLYYVIDTIIVYIFKLRKLILILREDN